MPRAACDDVSPEANTLVAQRIELLYKDQEPNEHELLALYTDAVRELKDNFTQSGKNRAKILAAKAICDRCCVRESCLDYALKNEPVGIWGGHTGAERKQIAEQRKAA